MHCTEALSPFGIIMMIIGTIILLAFLALIVVGAIYLVRYLGIMSSGPMSGKPKHDPLDIAKERYAKGEITKEEFERIKKDLS